MKKYDVVFNVAGTAQRKETMENAHLYYEVNEHLVVDLARKAKNDGVKQFIVLSSMSVYGKNEGFITKTTEPCPNTHYGISKLSADEEIKKLSDEHFKVAVVRPPMVYGSGCQGNYQTLRKFALSTLIFPKYKNERSMIYVGNLAEFIKLVVDNDADGLFLPQNAEYVNTTELVDVIAGLHGRKVILTNLFDPFVWVAKKINVTIMKKVFGNLTNEKVDCVNKFHFTESIKCSEGSDQ